MAGPIGPKRIDVGIEELLGIEPEPVEAEEPEMTAIVVMAGYRADPVRAADESGCLDR